MFGPAFGGEGRGRRARRGASVVATTAAVAAVSLALAGASWGAGAYDPALDGNSMHATTASTGAQAWWADGVTGKGIDVAVIDTGVAPVPGLDAPGKVVYGPDLSLESQSPAFGNLDTAGHGTFMAGLVAGRDGGASSPAGYRGMAPDARIVSLKVGTADGGVDVSQVIAAINWVIEHAHDPGLNIRVLNLSYGTNSGQTYGVDPLAYAAEQAWKSGIVVVASAGNAGFQARKPKRGEDPPCLANPAYDPYVIAVAASDTAGTNKLGDDTIASFSSGGSTGCKNPDFAAPGAHLQGLRVPNSFTDANHPEGLLDDRYFRGSGTSQAAAIVSGAVALVLERYPKLSPDEVKYYFTENAFTLRGIPAERQGTGVIDLGRMLKEKPRRYSQKFRDATGTGSLELSRGSDHLSRDGVDLTGEKDIFGRPFDASAIAKLTGNTWSGGSWNGSTWSGSSWSGVSWSGVSWSGVSWSGSTWSGSTWSGNTWSGAAWSGATWSGSSWSGAGWSGNAWSGGPWMGASWD